MNEIALPNVVVLDDWESALTEGPRWAALKQRTRLAVHRDTVQDEALFALVRDAQALVLNRDRTPLTADLIARMPALETVVHTGPRNMKLDRAALDARGIPVQGTDGGPGRESTCEQAWSLILAARRRLLQQVRTVEAGGWRQPGLDALPAMLHGKRLGLLGLGNIGSLVARVGAAFGMELVTWSPHMTPERAAEAGARSVPLEELMATSDVVTIHLVASASTTGLVDARLLALMKPDAVLVNTSRASLVVQDDLVQALKAGRPGVAALDVFDEEPLPLQHPLRGVPNVLITPHMGFLAQDAMLAYSDGVAGVLEQWLAGRRA
ncbi:D-2-hydroxyacid dehydrogenase family protein [Ramlibacter sp. G-1-2-2]|uniref:D-2-hydroxyacid dehydrogenase family protein n=1 Tax=Ramlibacter agri TaxID=2728837 RepID=A0A848H5M3_9BURK|nr:NAD(P)-dependent oxidoreductase [Ramlibacter agri]NML44819.1 D-2-hydroxyacid dehydrogenase family protein [Ramlibacter agri]